MQEKRLLGEKGGLSVLSITFLPAGLDLVKEGDYRGGVILLIMGIAILYLREYFKFHRWGIHKKQKSSMR